MAKYPYILKINSLKDFVRKVPEVGVPDKISLETLVSLGYKSSNDRPIVPILKFIRFADEAGTPTENYLQYRNRQLSKAVMAKCLRTAYSDLFKTYPNAQSKESSALRDFFSTSTTAGEKVLTCTVDTFKALCEFADFGAEAPEVSEGIEVATPSSARNVKVSANVAQGMTINLNVQLQLPVTEDATIYDKIFESLKKHLLER
jgi:hypothetical protein